MKLSSPTFRRRGIVEGFFGPPWSMTERRVLFEFGAPRGMNTYLYAPKDDPYHRRRWRASYPRAQWRELIRLIAVAQKFGIDFVYGFHPGEGLCFSEREPIKILLHKAASFYDTGVRTFAVLFDDIPSRLAHARDRRSFSHSLARAEGIWLGEIQARQPSSWKDVEWWICPSYYSEDPLLERVFGQFEPTFLDHLAEHLPANVACFWTGPAVVSDKITLEHMQRIAERIRHPLLLWDNYPVNDLSMSDELHIGPIHDRDPRLPEIIYAYLNNPLVQAELSLVPLATCFEYAASPRDYHPEKSWHKIVKERFGADAVAPWRTLRRFSDSWRQAKTSKRTIRLGAQERARFEAALAYVREQRYQKWAREIRPWRGQLETALKHGQIGL
jgi:hyaluronoglucosaminidase